MNTGVAQHHQADYPMLLFSGLYYPVQQMGRAIQDISHFTPLGAAVQAIGDSWVAGQFRPPSHY